MTYGEMYKGELILPAMWQSLWMAFIQFGIMVGAFGNGFMQDRFGRKISYAVGGTIAGIGTFFKTGDTLQIRSS